MPPGQLYQMEKSERDAAIAVTSGSTSLQYVCHSSLFQTSMRSSAPARTTSPLRSSRVDTKIRRDEKPPLLITFKISCLCKKEAAECTRLRLCQRQRAQLYRQFLPRLLSVKKKTVIETFRDDKGKPKFLTEIRRQDDAPLGVYTV